MENILCRDCGKKIIIKDKKIKNGKLLAYKHKGKKIYVYKCNECYEKDPALKDFQDCEVYSRVVGYLRPVKQWNKGKRQEFKEREEYKRKET